MIYRALIQECVFVCMLCPRWSLCRCSWLCFSSPQLWSLCPQHTHRYTHTVGSYLITACARSEHYIWVKTNSSLSHTQTCYLSEWIWIESNMEEHSLGWSWHLKAFAVCQCCLIAVVLNLWVTVLFWLVD